MLINFHLRALYSHVFSGDHVNIGLSMARWQKDDTPLH